jgi:hypothetical protein
LGLSQPDCRAVIRRPSDGCEEGESLGVNESAHAILICHVSSSLRPLNLWTRVYLIGWLSPCNVPCFTSVPAKPSTCLVCKSSTATTGLARQPAHCHTGFVLFSALGPCFLFYSTLPAADERSGRSFERGPRCSQIALEARSPRQNCRTDCFLKIINF